MEGIAGLLGLSQGRFLYGLLLFVRFTGLFTLSPIFGRRNFPTVARIGLSLCLAYLLLAANPDGTVDSFNLWQYALLVVKELLIGLTMGYMATLFLSVATMAGQIIDVQVGFGMAQLYDPETSNLVSLASSLLNYCMLLLFLAANGHHTLIRMLALTVQWLPVGQVGLDAAVVDAVVDAFTVAFSMAVTLSLPVLAAELVLEVIMGIMIRAVPQMNIFVVGIPVKLAVGLLAMLTMVPFFVGYGDTVFEAMFHHMSTALKGMIPA